MDTMDTNTQAQDAYRAGCRRRDELNAAIDTCMRSCNLHCEVTELPVSHDRPASELDGKTTTTITRLLDAAGHELWTCTVENDWGTSWTPEDADEVRYMDPLVASEAADVDIVHTRVRTTGTIPEPIRIASEQLRAGLGLAQYVADRICRDAQGYFNATRRNS